MLKPVQHHMQHHLSSHIQGRMRLRKPHLHNESSKSLLAVCGWRQPLKDVRKQHKLAILLLVTEQGPPEVEVFLQELKVSTNLKPVAEPYEGLTGSDLRHLGSGPEPSWPFQT